MEDEYYFSLSLVEREGQGEGDVKPFAKTLRKQQTEAEKKLLLHLRDRRFEGLKFRRQHPIGPFVTDFCCIEKSIILEMGLDRIT